MAWVEVSLDRPLSVEAMARRAGYSPPHFSRAFTLVAGESPASWLTGRRVSLAMRRLVEGDDRIVDIAFSCGFVDATTFTRAFRRRTGSTPSAFRRNRAMIAADGVQVSTGTLLRLPAFRLAGLSADVAADPAGPGRLWQRLADELKRLRLAPDPNDFRQVAYWRGNPASVYTCVAGFTAANDCALQLPFVTLAIPACVCRRFLVKGAAAQLATAYATVFSTLLPSSGDRVTGDFVIECPRPEDEGFEIWVPVSP